MRLEQMLPFMFVRFENFNVHKMPYILPRSFKATFNGETQLNTKKKAFNIIYNHLAGCHSLKTQKKKKAFFRNIKSTESSIWYEIPLKIMTLKT